MSFFEELKRRNVFRVGIAYVLLGWVVLQGADFALDLIDAPNWVIQTLFILGVVGLPFALFFSWAFEVTPEGIKREEEIDRSSSITPQTGRKLDRAIIGFLAVAVVLLLAKDFIGDDTPDRQPAPAVETTATFESSKSIAVLPFDDMSQAQDQGWFADGLAEEILNSLANAPDLKVASRTASFRFRDSQKPLEEIASDLGVAHILEGSVRSSGERLRVTAQLIRAEDGFHLWSNNYDRDQDDMIAIQEDLAISIAEALETSMDPSALADMVSIGTHSVEAYRAYLRANALLYATNSSRPYAELIKDSKAGYEMALEIDPGFAEAWWQLAGLWTSDLTPTYIWAAVLSDSVEEAMEQFDLSINKAIEHAVRESDRKAYQAGRAQMQGRQRDAIRLYRDYLKTKPNDFNAWLGLLAGALEVSDEASLKMAFDYLKSEGERDINAAISYLAYAIYWDNPSEVADYGLRLLEQWPEDYGLMYQTHRALMWAGRAEEGASLARRFGDDWINIDLVHARQACIEGRTADAEAILARVPTGRSNTTDRWLINLMLGRESDAARAIAPITNSVSDFQAGAFLQYPSFDPTPHPRVMEIIEREGIIRGPTVTMPFKCPPPEDTSIAVLPFVNMSSDEENEYFSDGISEEILNVLADIPELQVASRTSAFRYKGSDKAIEDIADELRVNHVLEGSVRKSGNQVRITAQLIKADDGFHLWSDTYDRELTNIFEVQDEIAGNIAEVLEVHLLGEQKPYTTVQDLSPEFYEKFLRARYLMRRRNEEDMALARELNDEVVAAYPDFPRGLIQAAESYFVFSSDDFVEQEKLEQLIRDAERLDPDLPGIPLLKAQMALYQGDLLAAIRGSTRALELSPENPRAHHWLGIQYAMAGYMEKARFHLQTSVDLEPEHANANGYLGYVCMLLGDFDKATFHYGEQVRLGNEFGNPRIVYIDVHKGNLEQARKTLQEVDGVDAQTRDRITLLLDAAQDPGKLGAYLSYIEGKELDSWHISQELFLLGQYQLALQRRLVDGGYPRNSWAGFWAESRNLGEFQQMLESNNIQAVWDAYGPPPACRKVSDGYDCTTQAQP